MNRIQTSALEVAQRYVGVKEFPGTPDNPAVLAMLKLDNSWPPNDETPWCSAFANWVCFQLGLQRSKSLLARSWLDVGVTVALEEAEPGLDVVVLSRDGGGHVGFFAGRDGLGRVMVLGGNQGDSVSLAPFLASRVLGVRRLAQAF